MTKTYRTLVLAGGIAVSLAVYVGNDSGPSHLAGICGVPTVAIFATTAPQVWRPLGPKVVTLQLPSVDDVVPSVTAILTGK